MVATQLFKEHSHKAILTALFVGIASLAGCGGGGVTPGAAGGGAGVAASPYSLFSSTYIAYVGASNVPYLHSIQGGDVYTGFGLSGNLTYGNYSSDQPAMNNSGFYILQNKATAAANTALDYEYVAVKAPGNGVFDISAAKNLIIQLGNTAPSGSAQKLTVTINNTNAPAPAIPSICNAYVNTLGKIGVRPYAIELTTANFTCSTGSLADLQSGGITTVAVAMSGDQNTSIATGEYNSIGVGTIGFTNVVTKDDQTALAL